MIVSVTHVGLLKPSCMEHRGQVKKVTVKKVMVPEPGKGLGVAEARVTEHTRDTPGGRLQPPRGLVI
jgi:hypothetical protein